MQRDDSNPSPVRVNPPPETELEALGERIAQLSTRITAARYQLLVLIREFDERHGWNCGFRSCAHWLNWRIGLGMGAARETVRVARALEDLPRISEAMRSGRISYSKVRAITRVATPENEAELLIFAEAGTAHHVERLVRAWRSAERAGDRTLEAKRHASRYLQLHPDDDGMVVVRGRLAPEAGAALVKAIEAAEQVLFDEGRESGPESGDSDAADAGEARSSTALPIAQRRADAVGRVAEAALAGGLDRGTRGDRFQVVVHVDAETLAGEQAKAPEGSEDVPAGTGETRGRASRAPNGVPARTAERPSPESGQPLNVPAGAFDAQDQESRAIDVPAATRSSPATRSGPPSRPSVATSSEAVESPRTSSGSEPYRSPGDAPTRDGPRLSEIEDIGYVPAATSRRIACDASRLTMQHDNNGRILDVGRRTRAISPALRRALTHRDGGCRFPGCTSTFCDAHHVEHWVDGGETKLENLVLLCRSHHRSVHEEGYRVSACGTGELRFFRPDGIELPASPDAPPLEQPMMEPDDAMMLLGDLAAELGVELDPESGFPNWNGSRFDLRFALAAFMS